MNDCAHLIRQLFDASGLGVKEYADHIGWSVTQLSNVLNENEPGSLKMLRDALQADHLDVCNMRLPGKESPEELALIEQLLFILRNDPTGRVGITVNLDYIHAEARRRAKKATSKQPESQKEDRAPPGKRRRAF